MRPTPILAVLPVFLLGAPVHAAAQAASDSAAVVETVTAFHGALSSGDGPAALELLMPDARILEGAGVETREEYAAHHLEADMAFAGAVRRERGDVFVVVRGDVAWAVSESHATGQWRDREIDSRTAELMVLTRHPDGWRIAAISWSSR